MWTVALEILGLEIVAMDVMLVEMTHCVIHIQFVTCDLFTHFKLNITPEFESVNLRVLPIPKIAIKHLHSVLEHINLQLDADALLGVHRD